MTVARACVGRLAAMLAAAAGVLNAQARATVQIVSAADNAPIASARVIRLADARAVRTDDRGGVTVALTGADSIRVLALGYRELRTLLRSGTTTLRLTPLPTTLATIVTTAGQREMRASDNPASITVLSQKDIAAAGAVSANQLLRQLPGLQELAAPPAQTSIAIRGLDASRVLVLIDGEPAAGGLIENRDIGRLSTLAADRIEVTKGPSSVEFGSDALGGVINLVTAAPSRTPVASLMMRSGELGRREAASELSNTYGPLGVRVNAGWRETDRVTGVNASGSTLDRVYDFRGDARYRVNERWMVRSDLQLSQQRQRWPVGGGFNGFIDNATQQALLEAVGSVGGGTMRVRAFGQQYAYQFRQAQGALPIAGSADSLEQTETLGRGLLAWSRPMAGGTLDVGAQFSDRRIVAPSKIDGNRASDQVTEVFARQAFVVGAMRLSAGARSTSSTLWGSTVAPSVGAVWHAAPTVQIRANVARGFRAPSFKEMRYTFLNAGAGYTLIGNPNLTPESSWSTSLGASWVPTRSVTLTAEAYRNAVRNLVAIRANGFTPAGLLIYENANVARAQTEGIELGARVVRGNAEWSLGYDHLRARDLETGRTLDGRARHTARLAVSQAWAASHTVLTDLSVRYTGASPVGTLTQAAFLSVDGQVRMPVGRGLEASIGVTNLLDQRPAAWTPAFQRQFIAGLSARWHGAR